jgi:hypothetical protein
MKSVNMNGPENLEGKLLRKRKPDFRLSISLTKPTR